MYQTKKQEEVLLSKDCKIPVEEAISLRDLWDKKAKLYNKLSELLPEEKVDILHDYSEAIQEVTEEIILLQIKAAQKRAF